MPNFTKKAIKETFIELLDERPLNKITVKDIVEACGINRNSFYYHYQDLPALLEEVIAERVQALMSDHPTIDSGTQQRCKSSRRTASVPLTVTTPCAD